MIPDFSGDYLKYEETNDGDICEIIDEGKTEFSKALGKTMFNLKVKKNEKVLTWSPNNEAGKLLQSAFGMDTKDWIGHKFQIFHIANTMKIKPVL